MTNKQRRAAQRLVQEKPAEGEGQQKVTNLWLDALRRLLRNRAAVLGIVIIVLVILLAVFAGQIAPYHYAVGDSMDNRMVPIWLAKVLPGHMEGYAKNEGVTSLAYSPDGSRLAAGYSNFTVDLWGAADGSLLRTHRGEDEQVGSLPVWCVAFSPDGQLVASGSGDTATLWRASDGALAQVLKGHFSQVRSVAFSPDGKTLASGSLDKSVQLWLVSDGTSLLSLMGHTKAVQSVAFSPDGRTVASGAADNTIRLWSVENGGMLAMLRGHEGAVNSVAFSPDGSLLASASDDNTVRLWRVDSGTLMRTLAGHTRPVDSVAFSPDGSSLATGSNDRTVRLWRVNDGALVRTLKSHSWYVRSVAFSPDGQTLVSGSADKTIRFWRVSDGAAVRTLRKDVEEPFVLGADYLGRDILSRIIYGARVSLPVGFMGALTALLIGLVYGCISGYYGGKVDNIMMRIVDIMYAFPTMLLIILLMAFFKTSFGGAQAPGTVAHTFNRISQTVDGLLGLKGGGMLFIFMGIGVTAWMSTARLARGQILSLKEKEFIEASRMIGGNDLRIIVRHILPNIMGPILISVTLSIPDYIGTEVFLSFIGLGVDSPTPSWGSMISQGAGAIRSYPNQVLFPALFLALVMFGFNFFGDGLRDALDPRMRGRS